MEYAIKALERMKVSDELDSADYARVEVFGGLERPELGRVWCGLRHAAAEQMERASDSSAYVPSHYSSIRSSVLRSSTTR